MRAEVLLLVAVLLGGCVTAPASEIEAADADLANTPPPPLREAARALDYPAGTSWHAVRLETTADDWVEDESIGEMLPLGFEGDGEVGAFASLLFEIEGTQLDWAGAHFGYGELGSGSAGVSGEPGDRTFLMLLAIHDAPEPGTLRLGRFDGFLDGRLPSGSVAAEVLDVGADAWHSGYVQFDFLFPSPAFAYEIQVLDDRLGTGTGPVRGPGELRVLAEHAVERPSLTFALGLGGAFGARASTWRVGSIIDGEGRSDEGVVAVAGPLTAFRVGTGTGVVASSSALIAEATSAAELNGLNLFELVTLGFDPARHGLSHEATWSGWGTVPPVAVSAGGGCWSPQGPRCHVLGKAS